MGDLKPKKKKKKKKKSVSKPKSALEVARNPQPYQIPLYYPPFPSPLPRTKFDNSSKVANALRNYAAVSKAEINRLRGDLTAYRQEAQTAFRQNVAFPRATINVGDDDITGTDITDVGSVTSSVPSAHDPDSDFTPSASSVSSAPTFGRAEGLVADMRRILNEGFQSPSDISAPALGETSAGEETLMDLAGAGAGRLTEPDYTTDTSVGSKSVRFNPVLDDFMDLTSAPESDFAPRATKQQRASRRSRVYVDNASNRRLGRVGKSY